MSQFIRLTFAGPQRGGRDLRIAVAHIVGYYPGEFGGAVLLTSDGGEDVWNVEQSCDEIDALIAGPGLFAPMHSGGGAA
jgi:hypothetical protein